MDIIKDKIDVFFKVFNAYPAEEGGGSSASETYRGHGESVIRRTPPPAGRQLKGDNMSEIESIIKTKNIKNNRYSFLMQDGETWLSQFSNNRNITPELAEHLKTAEQGETWKFEYVQDGNFKNITAMERLINVRDDAPTPAPKGDNRDKSFALSYAKDAVSTIYAAKIQAGQDVPGLEQMANDIVTMAATFMAVLEK